MISDYQCILNKLRDLPICIFFKDAKGYFLGCNIMFAHSFGFGTPEELVGKNDYALPVMTQDADKYREDDRVVIHSKQPKINIEESQHFANSNKQALTSKIPALNHQGDILGVLGAYYDMTHINNAYSLYKIKVLLSTLMMALYHYPTAFYLGVDAQRTEEFIDMLFHFVDLQLNDLSSDSLLKKTNLPGCLTKKEWESLSFFIRGKTIRQISDLLNRSPRTIESHLNQVKQKLGVRTKSELIDKAMYLGLVQMKINNIFP